MSARMKLYYAPGTIAIATAIALEETGIAYTVQRIDFSKGEQLGSDYEAINPKGRVPALDVNGIILTETGAILEYLAALSPELMPSDPLKAARARSVMYYLASTMHVNHAHKLRGARWADQQSSWADMTAKVPETMASSAAYLEGNCIEGPYILGDTFCIADAYLFMVCSWLRGDGVEPAQYPKVQRLMDTMEARASVRTVREKGMLK